MCVCLCILVSPESDQTVSALYPTGGGTQLVAKVIHIHAEFPFNILLIKSNIMY